ncbi:hypothetical protein ACRRTK_008722 [Alexandromys fortis]
MFWNDLVMIVSSVTELRRPLFGSLRLVSLPAGLPAEVGVSPGVPDVQRVS